MTDEQFDETFERMRTELNVTPSPEFVVKVRQQNEHVPARRGWNVWAWTGVAAACAAAVIALVMWRSPAQEPHTQTVQQRPRESFSPDRKPQESVSEPAKMTTRVSKLAKTTPEVVVPAAAPTRETEVLVPPDQLMGIRQLMASVRRNAGMQAAPTPTLIDPDTGELMKPKPIEIPLITVTPLPGDPESRGGGRENR